MRWDLGDYALTGVVGSGFVVNWVWRRSFEGDNGVEFTGCRADVGLRGLRGFVGCVGT